MTAPELLTRVVRAELDRHEQKSMSLNTGYSFHLIFHFGAGHVYDTDVTYRRDVVGLRTHSCTHLISHTEVKATLLIHGVIYPWKLCEFRPFQLERIIQKTVV